MDIFIRGIPFHAAEKDLKSALEPYLERIGVLACSVRIFTAAANRGKKGGLGILTLPTEEFGLQFLRFFGQGLNDHPPREQILVQSRKIACTRSTQDLDEHLVKSLVKEQRDKLLRGSQRRTQPTISKKLNKCYEIDTIECGIWSPEARSVPMYEAYYSKKIKGRLLFRTKGVSIEFEDNQLDAFDPETLEPLIQRKVGLVQVHKTISILYPTIASIIASESQTGEIIFTLERAPKMYRQISSETVDGTDLEDLFQALHIERTRKFEEEPLPVERTSSLDLEHACFAPFAFVYRCRFKELGNVDMLEHLSGKKGVPEIKLQRTTLRPDSGLFLTSFTELSARVRTDFDFAIAFQLNALFANGILPPYAIVQLLPYVSELVVRFGSTKTAIIMHDFLCSLSPANPLGELDALSHDSLFKTLQLCINEFERLRSPSSGAEEAREEAGMTYIYHATVTPAGCYFYGPKLEMQNRVLRKYPHHHEHFLRVLFGDEDGDQLRFEPRITQRLIYDGQFRSYLSPEKNGIVIAGRSFQFLGFSSSSLRTNSCWFMAPIKSGGEQLDAAKVIAGLGDFSRITCPGRCAARIGQAFSDTVGSIHVPLDSEIEIPDIERNSRCFSDGVGTISKDMLEFIWAGSEKLYRSKSTVFQIRFAGAKGVVSLDTRLQGSQLCLRPSMIKFRGSTDRNIEICSTPGWLPMVLNRPLIKLLEDLEVKPQTFLDLQQDAIEELRESTRSPLLAANFLKRQRIAPSVRLPWMIEALNNLGFDFRDDGFLERAFELALLTALRDLKHRARIPVPNGVTLIGIVDETGFLQEGEIYCPYRFNDGGEGAVEGYVLITRSPVHHPGDAQMAVAITEKNIPYNSPLKALKNVVVFSQHGSRDLPGMLSGGDLDGDLYNIIYDPRFSLGKLYNPAQYLRLPPKDLGRPVTLNDIVEFLLDFMQNNLLGLISTRHLITADKEKDGVNHPDCLKLAEMASTAVDFPKTGIKIDKSQLPRCTPVRPDFMAPGPRVIVKKSRAITEMEDESDEDGEGDSVVKYYESEKVLGHLYRAIDEKRFLREMRGDIISSQRERKVVSVIDNLWNYLEQEIPGIYDWTERLSEAKDIKDSYEKGVRSMMRDFADTPWSENISEVEVFIGSIVGRDKQTRRQKENSSAMREEFEWHAASIVESIKGENRADVFGVGMASLFLCRADRDTTGPQSGLQSFAWVVASVLLTEVDKLQKEKRSRK